MSKIEARTQWELSESLVTFTCDQRERSADARRETMRPMGNTGEAHLWAMLWGDAK